MHCGQTTVTELSVAKWQYYPANQQIYGSCKGTDNQVIDVYGAETETALGLRKE